MSKTLYVTDMDGTLLDDSGRVSGVSAGIISELSRRGALITVATARTPATVQPLLCETFSRLPAIVMTGAALWDRQRQRYLQTMLIDSKSVATILEICASEGMHPFLYALNGGKILDVYHDGILSEADRKFVSSRIDLPLKRFHFNDPRGVKESMENAILVFAMGEYSKACQLAERLRGCLACSVSAYPDVYFQGNGIVEILAPQVSKAAAVERFAKEIGAERLVAFGDNLNDLPMMLLADVAVAVDNALDQVKEAAHKVIAANTSDAVARFIAADFSSACQ